MNEETKWIVVTGASSGIGLAAARRLLSDGYGIVVTSRDKAHLQELYAEALNASRAAVVAWDLSDPDTIREYAKTVCSTVGAISGLVHCAGVQKIAPVHTINYEKLLEIFQINTFAAICLSGAFSRKKYYVKNETSFVLISSIGAHTGVPGNTIYAASKGAIEGFVNGSASEFAAKGIRINSIVPGRVRTPMVMEFMSSLEDAALQQSMEEYPLGWGDPEDAANFISMLLDQKSRWLTGQNYVLDGGHLVRESH